MHEHDGIQTLLQHPDPLERVLALKSKQVQPYHLRMALQDSDPAVRLFAAQHGHLTKELMSEVLAGEDHDLKHAVLARPDLEESHLEQVAFDPKYAAVAAEHPKMTEALRAKASGHAEVPDGVKQMHLQALQKNIGHITFPLLGEGRVHSHPMEVPNKIQAQIRDRYTTQDDILAPPTAEGALFSTAFQNKETPDHKRKLSGWVQTPKPGPTSAQTSKRFDQGDQVSTWKVASKIDANKKLHANSGHEAQHVVFSRISQKYGRDTTKKLLSHLFDKLPTDQRLHVQKLFQPTAASYTASDGPEETIAYLHNYLQDPNRRRQINVALGMKTEGEHRDSFNQASRAWKTLRRIAAGVRPEDIGVHPKPEANRLKTWAKKLKKRESSPSHQLGFSVSFQELVAIAQFLTQMKVSPEDLRAALFRVDGDPKKAVLVAYGLDNDEGRKAFENVKELKLHKNEDVLKSPKSIVPVSPEADELVRVLNKAYGNNEIQAVKLGGKHSSGSYMAQDEEDWWLLKPGSGKKSPASGVDETQGSQSRREAAFYSVAKLWGIKEVNPAHLIRVDGKEVAGIKMWPLDWVNLHREIAVDPNLPRSVMEKYRLDGTIWRWAVLDFVLGNPDRHGNNLLVGPADEGNEVALIDHGSAFAGHGFDPGNDQNSFVPYYLRVWSNGHFNGLTHEQQLAQMPIITGQAEEDLRKWVEELDPDELERVIIANGMDPAPAMHRLAEVQDVTTENMSRHINTLWLTPPVSAS